METSNTSNYPFSTGTTGTVQQPYKMAAGVPPFEYSNSPITITPLNIQNYKFVMMEAGTASPASICVLDGHTIVGELSQMQIENLKAVIAKFS